MIWRLFNEDEKQVWRCVWKVLEVFEKNELIVVKLFLEYCLKQCPIDEFEPRVTDGVKVINCKLAQANGGSTL